MTTDKPTLITFEAEGPEDTYGPSYPIGEWEKRWKLAQARLRELEGELAGPRGAEAFRQRFDLSKNPDRECVLKNHFTGCAWEYIGALEDALARYPNEERFTWAFEATIRSRCYKGKRSDGKNYSRAQFARSVALARALGVVSPMLRLRGHRGVVLAPHDAVCKREGNICTFIGFHGCNYKFRAKDGWCTWLP